MFCNQNYDSGSKILQNLGFRRTHSYKYCIYIVFLLQKSTHTQGKAYDYASYVHMMLI